MSFFGTLDRTTSSPAVSSIASRGVLSFLYPSSRFRKHPAALSPNSVCHGAQVQDEKRYMETLFIDSLLRAGCCKRHHVCSPFSLTSYRSEKRGLKQRLSGPLSTSASRRNIHIQTRRLHAQDMQVEQAQDMPMEFTREQLRDMVDYYYDPPSIQNDTINGEISRPASPPVDRETQGCLESTTTAVSLRDSEKRKVQELERLLADKHTRHEDLYDVYKSLPSPHVSYIPSKMIRQLLARLAAVDNKNETTMLRYISIVEDMRSIGLDLRHDEWTSAIAFAGRCYYQVSSKEVESAIHMFKEMQNATKPNPNRSGAAPFNVLHDVATKAKKFALADLIMDEMRSRGIEFNRWTYVGQIHYHGEKGDGDGVRRAYRELVDAGEIVDTVVLNCVISSLISAGEVTAALHVFQRMKELHSQNEGAMLPPVNHEDRRELARALDIAVRVNRQNESERARVQDKTSVAPDLRTYQILVNYYAVNAGELHHVVQLLHETRFFGVELHGSIFVSLFTGFARHGGIRYTSWNEERLESVWKALLTATEIHRENVYWGRWLVIALLRAFDRCAGKDRMLDVWGEVQKRWNPPEKDAAFILKGIQDFRYQGKLGRWWKHAYRSG